MSETGLAGTLLEMADACEDRAPASAKAMREAAAALAAKEARVVRLGSELDRTEQLAAHLQRRCEALQEQVRVMRRVVDAAKVWAAVEKSPHECAYGEAEVAIEDALIDAVAALTTGGDQ